MQCVAVKIQLVVYLSKEPCPGSVIILYHSHHPRLIFCLKQIVLYNLHQLGEGKYGASTITWAVELYSVVVQGYILQAG